MHYMTAEDAKAAYYYFNHIKWTSPSQDIYLNKNYYLYVQGGLTLLV